MKTILTSIFFSLVVLTSFSQTSSDSSEHLTFKGVPIDGTLDAYVSKMKQSGFTFEGKENGVAMLKGDFAGYKDCTIGVVTFNNQDIVSKIAVIFSEKDTWSTLSSNYFRLKELLTEKYGQPSESVEKFQTSYEPDDDNDRMHQVGMDRCKYYTTFETDKGNIQVSIESNGFSSSWVMLSYFDKINSSIVRASAIDDL